MRIKLTLDPKDAAIVKDMFDNGELDDFGVVGLAELPDSEPTEAEPTEAEPAAEDKSVNRERPTRPWRHAPDYPSLPDDLRYEAFVDVVQRAYPVGSKHSVFMESQEQYCGFWIALKLPLEGFSPITGIVMTNLERTINKDGEVIFECDKLLSGKPFLVTVTGYKYSNPDSSQHLNLDQFQIMLALAIDGESSATSPSIADDLPYE